MTQYGDVAPRTNAHAYGAKKMPYRSKAKARAVMANTSASNPKHREARMYAKKKLRKSGNGLMPSRAGRM